MNHSQEVEQVFFKSGSYPAIVLQFKEEILDQIPILVQKMVVVSWVSGIAATGYHGCSSLFSDGFHKFLAVITFIGDHITVFQVEGSDQSLGRRIVADLPACQIDPDRVAQSVDYGMDLGGTSTSRMTNSLPFCPPFPPAACWWTLMYVPSIIISSLSRSLDNSRKTFSQIPRLLHLENRQYALCHEPNRSGRSRQGAPVFRTQMIALIIVRLSLAGRPFPPDRSGGTMSLIRSHCSSLISCLLIILPSMTQHCYLSVSVILSIIYILQTRPNTTVVKWV
jgi:hypothetical protein